MTTRYVDFSAVNDGDGTTPAQAGSPGGVGAHNTLSGLTFSSGDEFWIRRNGVMNWTTTLTVTTSNVIFNGWPTTTDEHYSSRPIAGISQGWDSDVEPYARMETSTGGVQLAAYGDDNIWRRLRVKSTAAFSFSAIFAVGNSATGDNQIIYNCEIESTATTPSFNFYVQAINTITDGCTIKGSQTSTGAAVVLFSSTSDNNIIKNCTISEGTTCSAIAIQTQKTTLVDNCTISLSGSGSRGINFILFSGFDYFLRITNCTVTVGNIGVETDATLLSNFVEIRNSSFTCKSMQLIHGGGLCNFKFTQSSSNPGSYGIRAKGGEVFVEEGTFIAGNAYDLDIDQGTLFSGRNITALTSPPYNSARNLNPGIWIGDVSNNLGFFRSYQQGGEVETNSTARTGGAAYSLKLSPAADIFTPIQLRTGLEGKETVWVSLTPGVKTITIYGAHKLWGGTPPTDAELYFECDYVSSGSGATRTKATSKGTGSALTTDVSVWTGDTSLTIFSISETFTVGQACIAPIRVYLTKQVASAYVYIDPKPIVS